MKLTSPFELNDVVARLMSFQQCVIEVREEMAFAENGWLSLGTIRSKCRENLPDAYRSAERRGAFEWSTPTVAETHDSLLSLLDLTELAGDEKRRAESKVSRLLDMIATVVYRIGLTHPIFDPNAIECLPFKRATTVVADTSSIVQGALNFVTSYLHPAARVKVPGIVHMEIVNFGDRFFTNRHDTKPRRIDLAIDHIRSQAGQRVLLSLELRSNTEIERTFLLGDPLRNAFQPESDKELKGLNISGIIPAYCDRLILESARHHQAQASPGHPVFLLTGDQGLARMALAEGLRPLFYRAGKASDMLGKTFSGVIFNPFSSAVRSISLNEILWELATAFGSARLRSHSGASVTISTIGKDLPWSPYQSQDDLLWFSTLDLPEWGTSEQLASGEIESPPPPAKIKARATSSARLSSKSTEKTLSSQAAQNDVITVFRFNIEKMLLLLLELKEKRRLSVADVMDVVSAKKVGGTEEYRRFLKSAAAIRLEDGDWFAEPPAVKMADAIEEKNLERLAASMRAAPSVARLEHDLSELKIGEAWNFAEYERARTTYKAIAEILRIGCLIDNAQMYVTPTKPTPAAFAELALARFRELAQGERLIATGAWLESLIKRDGIHPAIARDLLNVASENRMLIRTTEGSTTDVRFENRYFHELSLVGGEPKIEKVYLYRGDYLIPGKSSSSLRIEGVAP